MSFCTTMRRPLIVWLVAAISPRRDARGSGSGFEARGGSGCRSRRQGWKIERRIAGVQPSRPSMMPDCNDDLRQQPRGKLCVSFRGQMNPIRLSRQAVEVLCCRDGPYASSMETA